LDEQLDNAQWDPVIAEWILAVANMEELVLVQTTLLVIVELNSLDTLDPIVKFLNVMTCLDFPLDAEQEFAFHPMYATAMAPDSLVWIAILQSVKLLA
jgi:hypothetical protein